MGNITTAEYHIMKQRLAKARGDSVDSPQSIEIPSVIGLRATFRPKGDDRRESELHNEAISYCKSKRWIYFHGSMAKKTNRIIGEPDLIVLAENKVHFIEFKRRLGKLSPQQLGLKIWAEKLGHTIHTCRSMDEFLKIVG
jgi:hypothetical protein